MTNETLHAIKPGSKISFVYGPGESPELRFTTNPVGTVIETGEDEWYKFVLVEFEDGRTEKVHNVNTLDEKGIGAYLAAVPTKFKVTLTDAEDSISVFETALTASDALAKVNETFDVTEAETVTIEKA